MNYPLRRAAPALALSLAPLAASAEPATAASASGTPSYRSAFADYKPWQDLKQADWRALNATTTGAMGAMADMSGMLDISSNHSPGAMTGMSGIPAQSPSVAAPGASAAASTPPHAGHHMHGGGR